jgi:hypothetical protein
MRLRIVALGLGAALVAQPLAACTQTAGKLERAPQTEATPGSARPGASRPTPEARADMDVAFATAVRETRAPYLQARAMILQQPAARAYLGERLSGAADERERFVASALIGWVDERKSFDDARAWLSDGARRKSDNALGYVQAHVFGENLADEAGPSIALPLLEIWIKTYEHEHSAPRDGPWGHGLWDESYEQEALASALHALGDPRGYAPLLAVVRDRGEAATRRRESLYMLTGVRDPRVDDALANVLQDEQELPLQRMLAADGLLERKPPQARAVMEAVLLDPRTTLQLQRELVRCLLHLGDLAAVRALELALERARDPELISDLCHALDLRGDRKTLAVLWPAASRLSMGKARTQCTQAIHSIRAQLSRPAAEQRVVPR